MMTTYFGEEMASGMLQIPLGQTQTDYEEHQKEYAAAKVIADVLNCGIMPIRYALESDNFVQAEVWEWAEMFKMVAIVLVVIASIIFIIKFRGKGLLASIVAIGYIALLSLVIRYTNAVITQSSLVAYYVVILLNYAFLKNMLKASNPEKCYEETARKFYLSVIPLAVVAIVFTLSNYFIVSSVGMALFWGLMLNIVYNFVITKTVFEK